MTTQSLATLQPAKVSLIAAMASKYHMEPSAFQQTIKATVMPSNATNEQMAAFLLVAHEYDLNPITKEIYAFPAKGGGVTPMVGVDGWINLAQRRPEFDGMEHEWETDAKGECTACTCKIYRKDRSRPVVVTEFMVECKRQTDPWRSHPRRMLRHRATVQAIRYAFGFAGIKDEDDAEVIYANATVIDQPAPNVVDLNARIAASVALPEPEPSKDWPQPDANGELRDVRGLPWIAGAHSDGKTCTADGQWRRKRGVDPEIVERLEREAMTVDAVDALPALEAEPAPDTVTEFEKIRAGISTANSQDEIDEWWDYSREVVITQSQRFALESVAQDRQLTLSRA